VLALREKEVELAGTEPMERFQPIGRRPAGDEGASPTPADGSDAPNRPRAQDRDQEEAQPMQVEAQVEQTER
jgi:hypothetical protein